MRETSRGPDLQASAAPPFLAAFELEAALVSPLLFLPHILISSPSGLLVEKLRPRKRS